MTLLQHGKVCIVGAGPGDPSLLTIRAAELIAQADDLVVDALVPKAVYRDASARVVYVGKRAGRRSVAQRDIEGILIRLARAGRTVVRLKGGDPSLFGRVGEEIAALEEAGIEYELVPGVTSALAAPLAVGLSVTERGVADRLVVMTGHQGGDGDALPELPPFDPKQTLVLLMALGNLQGLVEQALRRGYPADLPTAAISKATLPEQRWVGERLEGLAMAVAEAALETPVTVIFGAVADRLLPNLARAASSHGLS